MKHNYVMTTERTCSAAWENRVSDKINNRRRVSFMYEIFSKGVEAVSNFMYSYLLIILLLAVGLYFTFRTKFVQFRMLGGIHSSCNGKERGEEFRFGF